MHTDFNDFNYKIANMTLILDEVSPAYKGEFKTFIEPTIERAIVDSVNDKTIIGSTKPFNSFINLISKYDDFVPGMIGNDYRIGALLSVADNKLKFYYILPGVKDVWLGVESDTITIDNKYFNENGYAQLYVFSLVSRPDVLHVGLFYYDEDLNTTSVCEMGQEYTGDDIEYLGYIATVYKGNLLFLPDGEDELYMLNRDTDTYYHPSSSNILGQGIDVNMRHINNMLNIAYLGIALDQAVQVPEIKQTAENASAQLSKASKTFITR